MIWNREHLCYTSLGMTLIGPHTTEDTNVFRLNFALAPATGRGRECLSQASPDMKINVSSAQKYVEIQRERVTRLWLQRFLTLERRRQLTHRSFSYIYFVVSCALISSRSLIERFKIAIWYISIKTFTNKNVLLNIFWWTAAVIVCLYSSNFRKKPQFICFFLDVQDSGNPHSCQYHSLFHYLQSHVLMNLAIPQVNPHQSASINIILLKNCQCKSKLMVYLHPERY